MTGACTLEDSVSRALRLGSLTPELEEHARVCPSCREVALISRSLRGLAETTEQPSLPPAQHLIWISEIQRLQRSRERALAPIAAFGTLAVMVVTFAIAFGLGSMWPEISSLLHYSSAAAVGWFSGPLRAELAATMLAASVLLLFPFPVSRA